MSVSYFCMERSANLLGVLGLALADETERVIAKAVGLTPVDAAALNVIGHTPGISIRVVSVTLGITHPGAVRVVDRLVVAGSVERRPGVDGRTVGLHVTPIGRRLWQRQVRARSRMLERLVVGLDDAQRTALDGAVGQLLEALTPNPTRGEQSCRLCDERSCPQEICPVTLASLR
jgi:MarR family transcriptional regulator, negative regulator of the multidrug operon emrRAB